MLSFDKKSQVRVRRVEAKDVARERFGLLYARFHAWKQIVPKRLCSSKGAVRSAFAPEPRTRSVPLRVAKENLHIEPVPLARTGRPAPRVPIGMQIN